MATVIQVVPVVAFRGMRHVLYGVGQVTFTVSRSAVPVFHGEASFPGGWETVEV